MPSDILSISEQLSLDRVSQPRPCNKVVFEAHHDSGQLHKGKKRPCSGRMDCHNTASRQVRTAPQGF